MEQQMSNLTSNRVNNAPPCLYSAVDVFDLFLVKVGRKSLCAKVGNSMSLTLTLKRVYFDNNEYCNLRKTNNF